MAGGRKKKFTDAQIAGALRKADGLIPVAAKMLKTTRQTVHERVNRSPGLQQALVDIDQSLQDVVEGKILQAVKKGDMTTARWYAERKMRKRGYGTKIEIEAVPAATLDAIIAALGNDINVLRAIRAAVAGSIG